MSRRNSIVLICVTGVKGSGKTTAIKMLKKSGKNVFIVDDWIRDIYRHNKMGYKLIKKHFGNEYVTKASVDRNKLGVLVFNNRKELKKLNDIMVPVIYQKIFSLKNRKTDIFVELAIYINHEKKFSDLFEKIILIKSKNSFSKKIENNNKNPIKNKKIFYDFLIENTSDFSNLKNQLSKKVILK